VQLDNDRDVCPYTIQALLLVENKNNWRGLSVEPRSRDVFRVILVSLSLGFEGLVLEPFVSRL